MYHCTIFWPTAYLGVLFSVFRTTACLGVLLYRVRGLALLTTWNDEYLFSVRTKCSQTFFDLKAIPSQKSDLKCCVGLRFYFLEIT